MLKKIIFNAIITVILIMIGVAVINANKPKPGVFNSALNNTDKPASNFTGKEAKYYRVIER